MFDWNCSSGSWEDEYVKIWQFDRQTDIHKDEWQTIWKAQVSSVLFSSSHSTITSKTWQWYVYYLRKWTENIVLYKTVLISF